MNNPASLKISDLLARTSTIAKKLITEEDHYNKALKNNAPASQLEEIRSRINMLKRKQALFTQAVKMRQNKG